jgi:hypothetical protein
MWDVRCACGVEKQVRGEALINGRAKSCGCASQRFKRAKMEKRYGLVNQRFGRLLVLWRVDKESQKSRSFRWECRCDCGKLSTVSATALRSGKTQSCGCLIGESRLPEGRAVRNVVLARYKDSAQKDGRPWQISDARFDELIHGNCHYCGEAPSRITKHKGCNGGLVCNGIDRLHSGAGYIEGNVVSCCYTCNLMKRILSPEVFIAHIRKVLNHWDNKGMMEAKA